jgi:hypothetical protein
MRTVAASVWLLLCAVDAHAQLLAMRGSDTLESVMADLLVQCPALGYDGIDSS